MELDAGTFLLQLAAGGLLFLWVTTRRREVGLGYGWLLRGVYGALALGGALVLIADDHVLAAALGFATVASAAVATCVSVARRSAGVRGQAELRAERKARVGAMIGRNTDAGVEAVADEFPPVLDVFAPIFGLLGMLAAAAFAGGPYLLAAARLVVGAAFLGAVSDAMLLGHWYLVQPGLRRDAVKELVVCTAALWPFEVLVFVIPTGVLQVFTGTVDDGYDGLLGWVWLVCAITTLILVVMTWYALKERAYSAVMAATGLLYLAILTAFGMDLVPRAVLSP